MQKPGGLEMAASGSIHRHQAMIGVSFRHQPLKLLIQSANNFVCIWMGCNHASNAFLLVCSLFEIKFSFFRFLGKGFYLMGLPFGNGWVYETVVVSLLLIENVLFFTEHKVFAVWNNDNFLVFYGKVELFGSCTNALDDLGHLLTFGYEENIICIAIIALQAQFVFGPVVYGGGVK